MKNYYIVSALSGLIALLGSIGYVSFSSQQPELFGSTPVCTLPQGCLGTSTVPANYVVIGSGSLRVTAVSTSSLGISGTVSGGTTGMLTSWASASTLTATSSPTFARFIATSTTATSTAANGINITGGCFSVNGSCISLSGSGTVTNVATTYPITGGPITTTGTLALAFGTTTANTWSLLQIFANASSTLHSIATALWIPNSSSQAPTQAGQFALDTTNDQLKVGDGTATANFDQRRFLTFTYATTTTWTGTTTLPLGTTPAAAIFDSVQCYTNVGTLNVDYFYGPSPTHLALLNASTSVGTFSWTANNQPGAGATTTVSIGTPASSPSSLSCTISARIQGT